MARRLRWAYRVRQGLVRLRARWYPPDLESVSQTLPPPAMRLFITMSRGDQAHSLAVRDLLRRDGGATLLLEQAALLHDVGKAGAGLNLCYRTVIILLEALRPDWLARLAADDTRKWRRPFYHDAHHAAIGAVKCREAGCSEAVVALVRYHDSPADCLSDPVLRDLLVRLQRADDVC